MQRINASWILPITSAPLRDGAIVVNDDDGIIDVGPRETMSRRHPSIPETVFENAVIMPGLVNVHTHLELSMMKGKIEEGLPFSEWAYRVITQRALFNDETVKQACHDAIKQLIDSGTVAVGDIANHHTLSVPMLKASGLLAHVFHEVTGFPGDIAAQRLSEFQQRLPTHPHPTVSESVTPHALYSVSTRLLQLVDQQARERRNRLSIHLAESSDEKQFLETGSGPMKDMIQKLGRWDEKWKVPGSTPVGYAEFLGLLGPHLLAVHAVHVSDADIERLGRSEAHVCLCPRSNLKINVGGSAPARKLIDSGISICLGTDSLASNDDLDLWNEARAFRRMEPSVSSSEVLQCMTLNGASALGWSDKIGSIEGGKENRSIVLEFDSPITDPMDAVWHPLRVRHLSSRLSREFAPDKYTH